MTDPEQSNPMLLEVEDLEVRFPGSDAPVVDGVSFSLAAGRTLGLVGSSGCGKTTLASADNDQIIVLIQRVIIGGLLPIPS